jgi:anthranilate phosphoribosyltransferase
MMEKTANVLRKLGTTRSWVVHGGAGLDEIALSGKTSVYEVNSGTISMLELSAADFGVEPVSDGLPSNCSAEESAGLIREILNNDRKRESAEKLVLINAAAGIYLGGMASDLAEAYQLAEDSVRSGSAHEKLSCLVTLK